MGRDSEALRAIASSRVLALSLTPTARQARQVAVSLRSSDQSFCPIRVKQSALARANGEVR
jgi:hypothetical protein